MDIFQDQQQTESKHEIRITLYKNAVALGEHLFNKGLELRQLPSDTKVSRFRVDKTTGQLIIEYERG